MADLDTRPFVQIMRSLTPAELREITCWFIKNLGVTDNTLRYYRRGDRTPDFCKQQAIVKGLQKVLGIKTTTTTLFNGK